MMIATGKTPFQGKRFRFSHQHLSCNAIDSNWDVIPTDNYRLACRAGRKFAACYLYQLMGDRDMAGSGLLGHIAADIDFQDTTPTKGYWIGFFSYLEQHLARHMSECDVLLDLARVNEELIAMTKTDNATIGWGE